MPADPPIPLGLPWYFTAVLLALWLATVAGIVLLARRRLRLRRARRPRRASQLPADLQPVRMARDSARAYRDD